MLPKYNAPVLTMESLTDSILDAALERMEYTQVSLETTRSVCYQWLTTSSVTLSDLATFLQQLPEEEKVCGDCPFIVVEALCKEVRDLLNGEEALRYLPLLDAEKVEAAMGKACVSIPAEQMSLMLAHLAVGGLATLTEAFTCVLEENNISAAQVIAVAEAYKIS